MPQPQRQYSFSSTGSRVSRSQDRKGKGRARDDEFLDAPEVSRILQATVSDDGFDDEDSASDDEEEDEREGHGSRWILLGCACCFSMGAHYSSHVLAPLKSSLGASESGFSSLIASFELMNTITPLLSGFLVPRFGAARCGIVATGLIATGQAIVMLSGPQKLYIMIVGLALFGAGVSPLAVVQETILSQIAPRKSRITNKTIAVGLLLGKASSWFAAVLAVPLQRISPQLPFIVAFCLSLFSFLACALYAKLENRVKAGVAVDNDHAQKRLVNFREPPTYGDPFWIYAFVCLAAGGWHTFVHLSTNLVESLYDVSPGRAAANASLILFTSPFLYPLIGWALDKRPGVLSKMYCTAFGLNCLACCLLLMAPLVPIFLAVLPCAIGIGAGPLLIVVIVPRIVERHQIATALGIHKSVEMAGAVVYQTIGSYILGGADSSFQGAFRVVSFFLGLYAFQLLAAMSLWRLFYRREAILDEGEEEALGGEAGTPESLAPPSEQTQLLGEVESPKLGSGEHTRGRIGMATTLLVVLASWVAFFANLFR